MMASFEDAYHGNNHKRSALTDLLFKVLARSPDLPPFGDLLEPLAARDKVKRTDLVRTLRVYLYRSGLLVSQRIHGLHPPGEPRESLEASRIFPVGHERLAERLLQYSDRFERPVG